VNSNRFDNLLRSLSGMFSRRDGARALAGLSTTGVLASFLAETGVEAKRKKRKKDKKKKRKSCPTGTKKCGQACLPSTGCCADADCPAGSGQTCQDGDCRCPSGQSNSGGVCGTLPIGCSEPQVPCDEGPCCSGTCAPGEGGVDRCQPSAECEPCVRNDYCEIGLQCVGFVCVPV
jgi:hypothetical protein